MVPFAASVAQASELDRNIAKVPGMSNGGGRLVIEPAAVNVPANVPP